MHMLNSTTNLLTPWAGKQCHLGEEIIFQSKLAERQIGSNVHMVHWASS